MTLSNPAQVQPPALAPPPGAPYQPPQEPLRVLHEDDHLLVFDKPAGLLTVPGRGDDRQDCLAARAQARWPEARVVHRLDMATSGIVIMARGLAVQRSVSLAFEQRRVRKHYQAVVVGVPAAQDTGAPVPKPDAAAPDDGGRWHTINLPLVIDWPNRPRSIVSLERGKPSLTRWRALGHRPEATLSPGGGTTRLLLQPLTGRSHQLRVHLQAIGHPILGDPLYAPPEAQTAAPRLMLHACQLTLTHPATGWPLALHCPVPF